jgi:hypothetical protein
MAEVVKPTEAEITRRVVGLVTRPPSEVRVSSVHVSSIHADRDLGALWLAGREDRQSGRQSALREGRFAVELARLAGAGCVVVHAWDPNAPRITAGEAGALLRELAAIAGPASCHGGEESTGSLSSVIRERPRDRYPLAAGGAPVRSP